MYSVLFTNSTLVALVTHCPFPHWVCVCVCVCACVMFTMVCVCVSVFVCVRVCAFVIWSLRAWCACTCLCVWCGVVCVCACDLFAHAHCWVLCVSTPTGHVFLLFFTAVILAVNNVTIPNTTSPVISAVFVCSPPIRIPRVCVLFVREISRAL